jgi:hypothetical protein
MTKKIPSAVSAYMASIGRKGGRKGKGVKKAPRAKRKGKKP